MSAQNENPNSQRQWWENIRINRTENPPDLVCRQHPPEVYLTEVSAKHVGFRTAEQCVTHRKDEEFRLSRPKADAYYPLAALLAPLISGQ